VLILTPNIKDDRVEKTKHPCQFQVKLVERLALSLTNSGDSVFDMCVGSSAIAALKHGRKGFGCNVVEDALSITWDRIFQLRVVVVTTWRMDQRVCDPIKPHGGHQQKEGFFETRLSRRFDWARDNQKRYAVDVTGGGQSAAIVRKMSVNRSREMAVANLEGRIAGETDDLRAGLEEAAEAVGERVKLKANGFGGEGATRKPCPIERDFQLGFPPPRPFA
jgi:hypothetical protein